MPSTNGRIYYIWATSANCPFGFRVSRVFCVLRVSGNLKTLKLLKRWKIKRNNPSHGTLYVFLIVLLVDSVLHSYATSVLNSFCEIWTVHRTAANQCLVSFLENRPGFQGCRFRRFFVFLEGFFLFWKHKKLNGRIPDASYGSPSSFFLLFKLMAAWRTSYVNFDQGHSYQSNLNTGCLNFIQNDLQLRWLKKLRQIGVYDFWHRVPRWMEVLQSMSLDSPVLGGAVTRRQVWMGGWMEGSIRRKSDRHT